MGVRWPSASDGCAGDTSVARQELIGQQHCIHKEKTVELEIEKGLESEVRQDGGKVVQEEE